MPYTTLFDQCICGKQQCFSVQTQLCEVVASRRPTTKNDDDDSKPGQTEDVWGYATPIVFLFDPATAKHSSWIFLLSLCHHIKGFEEVVKTTFDLSVLDPSAPKNKKWFINRLHFPRALLENRATYNMK
jgi:hypothetical protein